MPRKIEKNLYIEKLQKMCFYSLSITRYFWQNHFTTITSNHYCKSRKYLIPVQNWMLEIHLSTKQSFERLGMTIIKFWLKRWISRWQWSVPLHLSDLGNIESGCRRSKRSNPLSRSFFCYHKCTKLVVLFHQIESTIKPCHMDQTSFTILPLCKVFMLWLPVITTFPPPFFNNSSCLWYYDQFGYHFFTSYP